MASLERVRDLPLWGLMARYKGMLLAIGIVALPLVMIQPLPKWAMDFMLTFNLAIAILILITTIYVTDPLQFSVFPSVLLVTTLYRLVLNVATTRLILGEANAGKVVAAFGDFVAGRDPLIGFVIFSILVVIQFVVITKGATRISEVAARFTLDAMPGKQMAIDADLNAGLINEDEARHRRRQITREADFYGAMDGASKFVRGDAIAGIIIVFINIIFGLILGVTRHGMELSTALETFTKLTIGDGLVTQIPAFIISISAGLVVSRATSELNLGEEMMHQLTGQPKALFLTAGFLGVLIFTPLPTIPLLMFALGIGGMGYLLQQSKKQAEVKKVREKEARVPLKEPEKVHALLHLDTMELEVGYGLIRLVDQSQGGDLLNRITSIRRQVALDLGVVVPPIRIRDNMQLESNIYVVKMRGVEVGRGELHPGQFLAMEAGGGAGEKIEGIPTREPAFGLAAVWITEGQRQRAEAMGYTVVDPTSVVATHLTEVVRANAHRLLTREEVARLVDTLKEKSPKVVEEVIPNILKVGDLQKVLQNLLRERVAIRDLETILETLGDYASKTKDLEILTEYVRNGLGPVICRSYEEAGVIHVVTLDPRIEDFIDRKVERTDRGSFLSLPPPVLQKIAGAVSREMERLTGAGHPAVLLTSPQVRLQVKRLTEVSLPTLAVLAYNELPRGVKVDSHGMVTLSEEVLAA
ncbi:MAG: flagellar biosynthesis protein FlhA [Planctomycetota bacterium]